ncbi:hypothetical protein [Actinoplanes sp. NPDC026670]|uniref:hypothetical protein n=1 Tax=Actinoplanes sp. NPDC026670 TaxID=3154700 RepID=UPI0033E6C96D
MTSRASVAMTLIAALVLAGCGGSSDNTTPEGALQALAAAANESDDDAIAALICPEALAGEKTLTEVKALAKEADPALDDFGYDLTAGPITEQTDTTAVGSMAVDVQGTDDASPAGQQFLDQAGAPLPVGLLRENDRINLIKRDGKWLACE